MISSRFILDILNLLLDGDETGKALQPQIAYLNDAEYNYTGMGLFVTFQISAGIESYKYHEGKVILDGVLITSTELSIGASAMVFVSDGFVNSLEIWSHDGKYPMSNLSNYTLKQDKAFSTGREIRSFGKDAKTNFKKPD